jgi:RNA polymerase sigma-70 factor (ECF subfamily)
VQIVNTATDRGSAAPGRPHEAPAAGATRAVGLDAAELDAFVRSHHVRLVRLARLVCRDAADATDAVQAGLEQAWRRRGSLADPARLRPWLDRIVVREAIRGDSRKRLDLSRLHDALGRPRVEPIDERATLDPDHVALRAAYEALSTDQRAVVALHLHLGYSVAETAELVDAPVETVRSRLRLARGHLRRAMQEGER